MGTCPHCAHGALSSVEVREAWSNWPPEGVETHHVNPGLGLAVALVAGCLAAILIYRVLTRK